MQTRHTEPVRPAELVVKALASFDAPWMWLSFSGLVLACDYLLGPFVHLSILFVFPVSAAAWHRRLGLGLLLALVLPWARLLFCLAWDAPWTWMDAGASCLVRAMTFGAFAFAASHLRWQRDEIRTLRGLLPICAHCKKIRDGRGTWQAIENYISSQTGAYFSHGICPDCLKRHHERPLAGD